MGIGDRRYSEAQIAAVIWTCLDGPRRVSVPEAMRHAAAGTLIGPDGKRLDAFEGNVGTFRDYVAREGRKRRRAETIAAGGRNAGAILAARLVDVGERQVRSLGFAGLALDWRSGRCRRRLKRPRKGQIVGLSFERLALDRHVGAGWFDDCVFFGWWG